MKSVYRKIIQSSLLIFLVLVYVGFGMSGCVEREEKIQVRKDGSVVIRVQYKADQQDELYFGRVPSGTDGWSIAQSREVKDNGDVKYILVAEQEFAVGKNLPGSYATGTSYGVGGADAVDYYLKFPNELKVEQREDGIYYHFHRIYEGRKWAYIDSIRYQVASKSENKELMDRDPVDLNDTERVELVRLMARVEVLRKLAFARAAYLELSPDGAQDGWLKTYADVLAMLEIMDYKKLATLMKDEDTDAGESALVALAEEFENEIRDRLYRGLKENCNYSAGDLRDYFDVLKWYEEYHKISEDLGNEGFSITIEMPGEIVGSNADEVRGGKIAEWKFKGDWFRDRDLELMVSSRVAY